jgi:Importin-beta N-terminal domain
VPCDSTTTIYHFPITNYSVNSVANSLVKMNTSKVFGVLNAACYSLDTNERQSAMKVLQNLEDSEGSIFALIDIIETENFPQDQSDCKLLSVITLKNIANRCWNSRATTTRSLVTEEKIYIKRFLLNVAVGKSKLTLDTMQDRKVLSQLTLLAAKVARSDWPAEWPELMPTLVESIDSVSQYPARLLVTMSFLEAVLSELSTKTIPVAKKTFTDASVQLFPLLAHIWAGVTTSVQSQLLCETESPSIPAMFSQGDSLMTVTKALHVIAIKAFPFLSGSGPFAEFLGMIISQIRASKDVAMKYTSAGVGGNPDTKLSLLAVISDVRSSEFESSESVARLLRGKYTALLGSTSDAEVARLAVVIMLDSSATKLAALLTSLQKDHPLGTVPYLEGLLDFAYSQLDARTRIGGISLSLSGANADADASCISFALFLSNTLSCSAYEPGESVAKRKQKLEFRIGGGSTPHTGESDDGAEVASELARKIRGNFFSEERITNLLQLLLERCLSYSHSELLEWQEDPEQFFVAQEGLREDDTLKTACEGLYLGLLDASPDLVAGIIAKLLNDVPRQLACIASSNGAISNEVVFWGNVYLCAGLNPATLGRYLDIPVWVSSAAAAIVSHLLQTSNSADDNCPQLLRAKSLWLLGMFAYRLEPAVLVQIVNLLLSVLESQTVDVVVVLGTIASLGQIFAVDGFAASANLDSQTIMRLVGALCSLTSQRLEEEESRERAIALVGEILRLSEGLVTGTGDGTNVQLLQALVAHFSCLWESSKPSSPLRVTITDTMTLLTNLAGPQSPLLHDAALPLIAYATSGSQESSFLVKEAVLLWLAILRNLPVVANDRPGSDNGSEISIYFTPQLDSLMQSSLVNIFEGGLVGDEVDDLKTVMMVSDESSSYS